MITVGIVGGSGFVAGELIRILINHPSVKIDFVYSHSHNGEKVEKIHQDLLGLPELQFTQTINKDVDVLFLSLGHGHSAQFLRENSFSSKTKIIDLSNDFRLQKDADFQENKFIYGLVEFQKEQIKAAQHIANPGCFASAIQLGLLPLAKAQLLKNDVHINAITGATGAGNAFTETSQFNWRNNNISIYKAFTHQHLGEIGESLKTLQPDFNHQLNFIPMRGDFSRGILATLYTACELSENELLSLYQNYYEEFDFVHVTSQPIHLKQVVNTNNTLIQVQKFDNKAFITTAIDNLLKGAAGQAIQNMNLLFGFPEREGLNLKANYF